MKKVVMISSSVHTIPPRKGAAVEWWMYQVAQRLTNFDMHIIAIRGKDEPATEVSGNIKFHRIRIGNLYKRFFQKITRLDPWSYSHRANSIISSINPDIVHVHNSPSLYRKLRDWNQHKTRQYILHMHNEKESAELPQSCNLFVVSRYLDNWYRSRLPSANIQIIANGVDTSIFQPKWFGKEAPPPLSKIDSSVFSAKKVIMYVGRMSPEKGPLKLARAFGELLQQRKDLFLLLVGEFSTGEGDRAKYSQAIRAQCALYADHCQLIDVIPPEHVHHVYSQADMLIIPSEFEEPFGMVCIEAMASGVPVLAPKRGGLLELINEPDYGYHIREPNNPTLFAKQISELIDMKDELQNTAKKAHLHVKNFYDWTHVAEQTECAYSNLVSEVMEVGGIAYSVVCKS